MTTTTSVADSDLARLDAAFDSLREELCHSLDREPTLREILAILLVECESTTADLFSDVDGVNIAGIELVRTNSKQVERIDRQYMLTMDDVSDGAYVAAADYLSDATNAMRRAGGSLPTADEFLALTLSLCRRRCPTLVNNIVALRCALRRPGRIRYRVGDVVTIAAGGGKYFFLIVIAVNTFGTAFGLFRGAHPLSVYPDLPRVPHLRHPVYSDGVLIKSGKWKIAGNRPDLLQRFPSDPEVFYGKEDNPDDPDIGPYGSAATASGTLRNLSQREAAEVGLLDGSYQSAYLEEDLESKLAVWLLN